MAKWENAPIVDVPNWAQAPVVDEQQKLEGTWPGEIYRALERVARRTAAAMPGTLATYMEAGARQPGKWYTPTPEIKAKTERNVRKLRRTAELTYKSAEAPELAPRKGGALGWITNVGSEAAGYLGGATAATLLGGPAGAFAFGATTGGETMYQEAMRDMEARTDLSSEEKSLRADTERLLFGPIYGAIERLQAGGVLKLGKGGIRPLINAARQRAWKELAKQGAKATGRHILEAAWEGIEEALQESVQIGAATIHGRMPEKSDIMRSVEAFVGGAVAGGILKGGRSLVGSVATIPGEVQTQRSIDALRAVTAEQAPAAVSTVAQEPGAETKPRVRIMGEPGAETAPEAPAAQTEPEGTPVSARHAYIEGRRESIGLPAEPDRLPKGTREQWRQEAIDQGKVEAAFNIAADVLANPRAMTPQESEGVLIRSEQIAAEYDALSEQLVTMPADSPDYGTAQQRLAALTEQYDGLSRALHQTGTSASYAMLVRKGLGDNTNTLSVLGRAKAAAGKELDAETTERLTDVVKRNKYAQKRAAQITEDADTKAADEILKDATRRPTRRKRGRGLARYGAMTDAQKDAELQGLLGKELTAKNLYDIVMNLASRGGEVTAESIARRVQQYIPGIERADIVKAMIETTRRRATNTNAMVAVLSNLRRTYRKIGSIKTDISDILYWLERGESPERPGRKLKTEDDVVVALQGVLENLRNLAANSEPAQQQKIQKRLDFLRSRIANRDFAPKAKKTTYEPSREVLRMQFEASRMDAEVRHQIDKQKPWTWRGIMAEPLRTVMALKSSFDMSGLGNQGGWALFSHPLRTLRRVPQAFQAFASERKAFEINKKIRSRDNTALYHRDGLELTEATGHDAFTRGEEVFRSTWAEFIPGVRASNRSFATLLNLIRADSYDALAAAYAGEGGPTRIEGRAIADFVNMATGRGHTRGIESTVAAANGILWAPRRMISRFQMLATAGGTLEWGRASQPRQMKYSPIHLRGTAQTRKMFAMEIGRYLAGLFVSYQLLRMLGFEIGLDSRSTDFGKASLGNVRVDLLSGLAQTLTFVSRMVTGESVNQYGDVVPLRGEDRPYAGRTMDDVGTGFLRNKLSPGIGMAWSAITGEDSIGNEVTIPSLARDAFTPISMEDVYEAMVDQGFSRGAALSMLGIMGIGIQIYGDDLTRSEYKELYGQ